MYLRLWMHPSKNANVALSAKGLVAGIKWSVEMRAFWSKKPHIQVASILVTGISSRQNKQTKHDGSLGAPDVQDHQTRG